MGTDVSSVTHQLQKGENALNPLSTQKKDRMRLQEDVTYIW